MQIQVQIGDTRRVFFMTPPRNLEELKKSIMREIPKTRSLLSVYYTKTTKENMSC